MRFFGLIYVYFRIQVSLTTLVTPSEKIYRGRKGRQGHLFFRIPSLLFHHYFFDLAVLISDNVHTLLRIVESITLHVVDTSIS